MKIIALTSADEAAMAAVAEQLLNASRTRALNLSVLIGIDNAHQAQAVYAENGELWRIGDDDTRPELDVLVDREIVNHPQPAHLEILIDQALQRFLGKTRVAA
jgi:hypothetical protein